MKGGFWNGQATTADGKTTYISGCCGILYKMDSKVIRSGNHVASILITDEKNQRYATGFPFTAGYVMVAREKAWLDTLSQIQQRQTTSAEVQDGIHQYPDAGAHP